MPQVQNHSFSCLLHLPSTALERKQARGARRETGPFAMGISNRWRRLLCLRAASELAVAQTSPVIQLFCQRLRDHAQGE